MTTTKPPVLTDEEIYKLIQPHPKEIGIVGVARAIEQAVLARAGAGEVDAERYRKVKQLAAIGLSRDGPRWVIRADLPPSDATTITQDHFEQAIDAAIAASKGAKP